MARSIFIFDLLLHEKSLLFIITVTLVLLTSTFTIFDKVRSTNADSTISKCENAKWNLSLVFFFLFVIRDIFETRGILRSATPPEDS